MYSARKFFHSGLILTLLSTSITISAKYFSEDDIPEIGYLDSSVDPCDNFYGFTCGNFGKIHSRPSNLNILDHFVLLEDELIKLGREILSSPKEDGDPLSVKKAKAAYSACANVNLYSNLLSPELRTVQEFGGLPLLNSPNATIDFSWNDIGDLVSQYGVPLIFVYTVGQLSQNKSVIAISPDGLTNPTLFRPQLKKSYDEVLEESFRKYGKKRVARSAEPLPFDIFLQTVAKNLLQYSNITKSDEEVVDELNDMANFMRELYAGGIVDTEVLPFETEITVQALQEWTHKQFGGTINLDWVDYLNRVFRLSGITISKNTKLYQVSAKWIYGALNLVKQTDPKIVKNFAMLRVFLFQAPDSDYVTRKAFEDYYAAIGNQVYSRWEYCTRKILDVVDTASLSYAVTNSYQRYYYNINKISQAAEMVQNIRNSFNEILQSSDWMDTESRDAALQKLKNMLVLLGYPDFVNNNNNLDDFYKNFRICEWDNYGNSKTIRAFKQAYQLTQLKPDRFFWGKSTFDPNAYYNRPNNKIVIPISMLNPVFFNGDNPILDYSRLGSIIGHEITHGFDVNGKNYNQDGILDSWWTDKTMSVFTERTKCFADQYSQYYVPEIDTYVNGSYCINENLADNGGVRESFRAFKKIIEEKKLEATGSYSLEQLFFIGYGTMWCSEESEYALQVLVSSVNGYPPNRYRVVGSLSNMEEFSEAFSCPLESRMNPKKKCLLWG